MFSIKRIKTIIQKSLAINSKPTQESFPELNEALIWLRFVLGLSYGLYLGLNDIRSATIFLQALNLIAFVPLMYARFYLGADQESFGSKLVFAGTFNALALCLLIWIYFYTAQHEEEESRLASLLVMSSEKGATMDTIVDDETKASSTPEEPEF